jgi:uncharacterized membrane protein YbhN (UPF0104 family)
MTSRLARWRTLGALVAVVALGAAAAAAWAALPRVDWEHLRAAPGAGVWLVWAALAFVVAQVFAARLWVEFVRLFAQVGRVRREAGLWLLSQLGKYVPGNVAGLALRAWHSEARPAAVAAAFLSEAVAHVAVSSLVGAGVLVVTSGEQVGVALGALVGIAVVLAARRPVLRALDRLLVRLGRSPLGLADRPLSDLGPVAAGTLLYWILSGGAFALFCHGLGYQLAPVRTAAWFVLAWCAGFLAVPIPGGLGVREAVLVSGLAASMGAPAAILVAVGYRAWSTILDVAVAGAGSALALGAPAVRSAISAARSRQP